jgi:hypothetical protein
MTPITISELEQAINAARQAQPAEGQESALSADVAILADIYGQLIYRGHRAFDADSLEPDEREALLRWRAVAESMQPNQDESTGRAA